MTEIREYRGKRVDNGEWVYGMPYADYMICGMTTAYYDDEVPMSEYREFDYVEVDPETVGQWSGTIERKPVYGKTLNKVFDGDNVRCYGGEYLNGVYEHDVTFIVDMLDFRCVMELGESEYCEIIGNIYNKEVE